MCCSLCDRYRVIKAPGIGGTIKTCSMTDREVDPKDCNCNEFVPVFPRLVTELEKKTGGLIRNFTLSSLSFAPKKL